MLVAKSNPCHNKTDGRFCSGGGSGGSKGLTYHSTQSKFGGQHTYDITTVFSEKHKSGTDKKDIGWKTIEATVLPPSGLTLKNLVGYAILPKGKDQVSSVYVHPKFRRKGVATKLYQDLETLSGKKIRTSAIQTPEGNAFSGSRK